MLEAALCSCSKPAASLGAAEAEEGLGLPAACAPEPGMVAVPRLNPSSCCSRCSSRSMLLSSCASPSPAVLPSKVLSCKQRSGMLNSGLSLCCCSALPLHTG